jgi:hypothetical protein
MQTGWHVWWCVTTARHLGKAHVSHVSVSCVGILGALLGKHWWQHAAFAMVAAMQTAEAAYGNAGCIA